MLLFLDILVRTTEIYMMFIEGADDVLDECPFLLYADGNALIKTKIKYNALPVEIYSVTLWCER